MSEKRMVQLAQAALDHHDIRDTVLAVGQLTPRGQSGSTFAGGLLGDDLGGAVGVGVGAVAGRHANAMASGLPATVFVAVSETMVYGLHAKSRRHEPDAIVFTVPRDGLEAKVHQRVNVRILELVNERTGQSIQLEGNRLPITHSNDVMRLLGG